MQINAFLPGSGSQELDNRAEVLVSDDGITFFSLGNIGPGGTSYLLDFFDTGLTGVSFVKIVDSGSCCLSGNPEGGGDGFNIESVEALNSAPTPRCDVQLSQASYIDGETITANVLRIANLGPDPLAIELKGWFEVPGESPIPQFNVGADGSIVLAPGFDNDFGPLLLQPVTPGLPRGSREFNCRLLDQVTGGELALDVNPFEIQ